MKKLILILILFTTACATNNKQRGLSSQENSTIAGLNESDLDRKFFGIKWSDLLDQKQYSNETLRDPLTSKKIVSDLQAIKKMTIDELFEDLIRLIELNLTFREKANSFFIDYAKQEKKSPEMTKQLNSGSKEFLLMRYLNSVATLIYKDSDLAKRILSQSEFPWYKPGRTTPLTSKEVEKGSIELKKVTATERELNYILFGMAAAFTLYDNYFLLVKKFESNVQLNRVLSQGDEVFGLPKDTIENISENSRQLKYRYDIAKINRWLLAHNYQAKPRANNSLGDIYNYLITYIRSTSSFKFFSLTPIKRSSMVLGFRQDSFFTNKILQEAITLERNALNSLSGLFGNTMGMFESRKGYLYYGKDNKKLSPLIDKNGLSVNSAKERLSFHTDIRSILQPGDIILEKTPFRLTDKFIPGHWGHVAVWTGTKSELQEKGLWNIILSSSEWNRLSEDQKKYIELALKDNFDDPAKDRGIVEALRPGVQMNSLYHYMNIDDILVARPKNQTNEYLAQVVVNAFSQVLKDYDFNFDVKDANKIVCSELVWQTHTDCSFDTSKVLARDNITPDNVAQTLKADLNGKQCFDPVYLAHDGKFVNRSGNKLRDAVINLNNKSTLD